MEQPHNIDAGTDIPEAPQNIDSELPAMSVVLPADKPETIRGVLNRLQKQTMAGQLEILLATPYASAFDELLPALTQFHSVSVVELRDLTSLGEARALAIKAARAPCVFLGETHSYASVPEWGRAAGRPAPGRLGRRRACFSQCQPCPPAELGRFPAGLRWLD